MKRKQQRGLTTVEFAIVGMLVVTLLFGIIEFSRIVFTMNILQEGARRATRLAVVCPVNDTAIAKAGVFMHLPGLSEANVDTWYLDQDGRKLDDPAGADYALIRYVRVRIVNYSMGIAIPLINPTFRPGEFSSTLPRESLGVPATGTVLGCDVPVS